MSSMCILSPVGRPYRDATEDTLHSGFWFSHCFADVTGKLHRAGLLVQAYVSDGIALGGVAWTDLDIPKDNFWEEQLVGMANAASMERLMAQMLRSQHSNEDSCLSAIKRESAWYYLTAPERIEDEVLYGYGLSAAFDTYDQIKRNLRAYLRDFGHQIEKEDDS